MDPLPPPPAPEDISGLKPGPWRGRYWLGMRLSVGGSVGGLPPARGNVVAMGGGVDFGVRINNWIGIGTGMSGQVHDFKTYAIVGSGFYEGYYGNLFLWDIAFARVFVPLAGRVQPYLDLGAGLTSYNRPFGGYQVGGHMRSGVGIDLWLTPNLTFGPGLSYRLLGLELRKYDGTVSYSTGHMLQGVLELGLHW